MLTEDTVHLHLEQRVAQRLLARFRAQGFVHHDLSRACLAQAADSIPRVVLLGRLSLYGRGAERLHEELVPLAARWVEPSQRNGPLSAYAREAEAKTLELLERSLGDAGARACPARRSSGSSSPRRRATSRSSCRSSSRAPRSWRRSRSTSCAKRGEREEKDLRETLERQRERVREELAKHEGELPAAHARLRRGGAAPARGQHALLAQRASSSSTATSRREPQRIREFYEVRAQRVEPVGLVYLWPETN